MLNVDFYTDLDQNLSLIPNIMKVLWSLDYGPFFLTVPKMTKFIKHFLKYSSVQIWKAI